MKRLFCSGLTGAVGRRFLGGAVLDAGKGTGAVFIKVEKNAYSDLNYGFHKG